MVVKGNKMKKLTCSFVVVMAICVATGYHVMLKPASPGKAISSATTTGSVYALKRIPSSAVHHSPQGVPHIRNANGTSLNWSGYAVETSLKRPQKGAVSYVTGSWRVPTISASGSANTYSSIWVGIDGYSSSTVEQIGTEHDWTPNGQEHYAWFEMYPKGAYEIVGFPVAPGDQIVTSVTSLSGGLFQLTIINTTEKVSYTVPTSFTKSPSAKRSSAEWIVEAPWSGGVLPLADFGTATFTGCSATLNNYNGPISNGAWQFDAMTMETSDGTVKAVPSTLRSSGTSFSVVWDDE